MSDMAKKKSVSDISKNDTSWIDSGYNIDLNEVGGPDFLDISEFLEDSELDYTWKLCRVSADLFKETIGQNGEWSVINADKERLNSIRSWFSEIGVDAALSRRPVISVFRLDGSMQVLDGYHRLSVAILEFGCEHVTCAVGIEPDNRREMRLTSAGFGL